MSAPQPVEFLGDPWERQPREGATAYAAFESYRQMQPPARSAYKACKELSGPAFTKSRHRRWERWSSRYHWVLRARMWDAEVSRTAREAELDAIREMRKNHILQATALQGIARMSLNRLRKVLQTDESKRLPTSLIASFLKEGMLLERLSRGEPDKIVRQLDAETDVEVVWSSIPVPTDAGDESTPFDGTDAAPARGPDGGSGE